MPVQWPMFYVFFLCIFFSWLDLIFLSIASIRMHAKDVERERTLWSRSLIGRPWGIQGRDLSNRSPQNITGRVGCPKASTSIGYKHDWKLNKPTHTHTPVCLCVCVCVCRLCRSPSSIVDDWWRPFWIFLIIFIYSFKVDCLLHSTCSLPQLFKPKIVQDTIKRASLNQPWLVVLKKK